MRTILLIALFACVCEAEEVVRLRRGGSLRGEIRSQSPTEVVLELASGRIRIPAQEVASIERIPARADAPARKVVRDEWNFLIRNGLVAGWCRVLHWEQGDHVQVEEHRVYLPLGSEPRRERRRVEIVDRAGRPREYLWMETVPGGMEVWSGQILGGRHVRQHRQNGALHTRTVAWQEGVTLGLPAWSAARGSGTARTVATLDPRKGQVTERRFEPTGSPLPDGGWDGKVLPTTAARIALAREAFAPADAMEMAVDATLHPLTPRDRSRSVHHLPGGVTLTAPDPIWVETMEPTARGLLLQVESRATFVRVEVHAFATDVRDSAALVRDFKGRLAANHDWVGLVGPARETNGVVTQRLELRQGRERMQAVVRILRRKGEYVAFLGIAPLRRWHSQKAVLLRILESATVAE